MAYFNEEGVSVTGKSVTRHHNLIQSKGTKEILTLSCKAFFFFPDFFYSAECPYRKQFSGGREWKCKEKQQGMAP